MVDMIEIEIKDCYLQNQLLLNRLVDEKKAEYLFILKNKGDIEFDIDNINNIIIINISNRLRNEINYKPILDIGDILVEINYDVVNEYNTIETIYKKLDNNEEVALIFKNTYIYDKIIRDAKRCDDSCILYQTFYKNNIIKEFQIKLFNSIKIEKWYRMNKNRKYYNKIYKSISIIQRIYKNYISRKFINRYVQDLITNCLEENNKKKSSINKIINIIKDYSYKKVLSNNKNLEQLIQENKVEFNIKYNNLIEQNKVLKHNYETMLVNHNSKYNQIKKEYLNEIHDVKNECDEKIYSIETRRCIKQDTNNFMNTIEFNILKDDHKELNDSNLKLNDKYNELNDSNLKLNDNIITLYSKNDAYKYKNKRLINKIDIVNEKLIAKTNKLEVVYEKYNELQETNTELQETNNELQEVNNKKMELEKNILFNGIIVYKKNKSSTKDTYIFTINMQSNVFGWKKLDGINKTNKLFSEYQLYSDTHKIDDLSFGLALITKEYIFDTDSEYMRNLIVKYMNKIKKNRRYNRRNIEYS